MDFKVFLSDDALSDLERIVAYIAPHNLVAAERLRKPVSPAHEGLLFVRGSIGVLVGQRKPTFRLR
jgi:plasmid stabilization system protein ParE